MEYQQTNEAALLEAEGAQAIRLLSALQRGQQCEVDGYKLTPDEQGVWMTDPYGVDCGSWQDIALEKASEFLARRGDSRAP